MELYQRKNDHENLFQNSYRHKSYENSIFFCALLSTTKSSIPCVLVQFFIDALLDFKHFKTGILRGLWRFVEYTQQVITFKIMQMSFYDP